MYHLLFIFIFINKQIQYQIFVMEIRQNQPQVKKIISHQNNEHVKNFQLKKSISDLDHQNIRTYFQQIKSCNDICGWEQNISILQPKFKFDSLKQEKIKPLSKRRPNRSISNYNPRKQNYITLLKKQAKFLDQTLNKSFQYDNVKFPTLHDIHLENLEDKIYKIRENKSKTMIPCKNDMVIQINNSNNQYKSKVLEELKFNEIINLQKIKQINQYNFISCRSKTIKDQDYEHIKKKQKQKTQREQSKINYAIQNYELYLKQNHIIKGRKLKNNKVKRSINLKLKQMSII